MRDNKFTQRGHCMSQLLNRLAGNGIRNNLAFAVAVLAIALLTAVRLLIKPGRYFRSLMSMQK